MVRDTEAREIAAFIVGCVITKVADIAFTGRASPWVIERIESLHDNPHRLNEIIEEITLKWITRRTVNDHQLRNRRD